MPTFMRIFSYRIYFWSNENEPLEPVHVHISEGNPSANATKYWINSDGSIEQENNNSLIPLKDLRKIEKTLQEYSNDIIDAWTKYFNETPTFHDEAQLNKLSNNKGL